MIDQMIEMYHQRVFVSSRTRRLHELNILRTCCGPHTRTRLARRGKLRACGEAFRGTFAPLYFARMAADLAARSCSWKVHAALRIRKLVKQCGALRSKQIGQVKLGERVWPKNAAKENLHSKNYINMATRRKPEPVTN